MPNAVKISQHGFTLIDLAVFLVLLSILSIPIMRLMDTNKKNKENTQLYGVTYDLSLALSDYALRNGAYPLPADPSMPIANANAFTSIRNNPAATFLPSAADCDNNTSLGKNYAGAASANGVLCRRQSAGNANANQQVYVGALPVTTLGLPIEAGMDQYGRKFTYVVTRILTPTVGIPRPLDNVNNNALGSVIVRDQLGGIIANNAHFAVITHGANKAGAYAANGTISAPNTCGAGLDEFNRRACTTGGAHHAGIVMDNRVNSGIAIRSTVNTAQGANYFDDALAFRTTINGKIWTPRNMDQEFFTLGRRVGVGYTNADPAPSQMLSVKTGNVRATGNMRALRLCNEENSACFQPDDIVEPTATTPRLLCTQTAPLKRVYYNGWSNAEKECEVGNSIKIQPILSGMCAATGIRNITSMGVVTCM